MTENSQKPDAARRRLHPIRRLLRRLGGSAPTAEQTQPFGADVAALHAKVDRLTALVERLASAQKQDAKWRVIFRRQLTALVRNLYLTDAEIPNPNWLNARRFRLHSQNEEDGIILALLKAAGVRDRRFVEIGCGGTGGNSATLAYDFGWNGLMVDASKRGTEVARELFKANAGVVVMRALVTTDNINDLLREHGFAGEVDLMSIDVDSNDYWLWDALQVCSPRILVMEYNALFGPERALTLPNAPRPKGAPKAYSGASLVALEKLARRKGYRLVLCEDAGVNAFFLRNDVAASIPGRTAAQAFRPLVDRHDTAGERLKAKDVYRAVEETGLPLVEV